MPVPKVKHFLPVAGTHGWRSGVLDGQWWQEGSPWLSYMDAQHRLRPYNATRPFVWSTALDGVRLWPFGRHRHHVWDSAGHALYAYLSPPWLGGVDNEINPRPTETRLVCHSHGLQVALYAAKHGLRIQTLVSVMSPVRQDMLDVAVQALPNIGTWVHVYSDTSDRWQVLGSWGDGTWGWVRQHPLAHRNVRVPRAGHTQLVTNPNQFGLWASSGLTGYLRD